MSKDNNQVREDKIEVSISEMYFTEEEFDKIKDAI